MDFIFKPCPGTFTDVLVPDLPNVRKIGFYTRGKDLPHGIPRKCNPREQDITKPLYRQVAKSYQTDPWFPVKSKGITNLAKTVVTWDGVELLVSIPESKLYGTGDGAHTLDIVWENSHYNPNQSVWVTLFVGIPAEETTDTTVAWNAVDNVSQMSMYTSKGYFDWLRTALHGQHCAPHIKYMDNEGARDNIDRMLVTELIYMLYVLRPIFDRTFETGRGAHPSYVFTSSSKGILNPYPGEIDIYKKFIPMLPDIFRVFDHILINSYAKIPNPKKNPTIWEEANSPTLLTGALPHGVLHGEPYQRMKHQAAMVVLSSLSQFIVDTGTAFQWKYYFSDILQLVDAALPRMLAKFYDDGKRINLDCDRMCREKTRTIWGDVRTALYVASTQRSYREIGSGVGVRRPDPDPLVELAELVDEEDDEEDEEVITADVFAPSAE